MASITLKGNPVNTVGDLPAVGSAAPAFNLTKTDLSQLTLADLEGRKVVLNIFPSIDTPVCAASVRAFHQKVADLGDAVVVCVSADLPFAHARFCGAEGIDSDKIVSTSAFRDPEFGKAYGVTMTDGAIAGLFARSIVVLDGAGKVTYSELVPEIAQEPDYGKALAALG